MSRTLLPSGCYDLLPPYAGHENALLNRLLAMFELHGYEQVSPPLLEYTDSLLSGRGGGLAQQIFRVMDPGALKVMGIRPDITLQIARIAGTRLAHVPLPLRVCYAGNVLRMKPEGQSNARQFRQAGIELIGSGGPEANAEVLSVASAALAEIGIGSFTVDLHLPGILADLLSEEALSEEASAGILDAVAHKDISNAALAALECAPAIRALIECCGPADEMLPRLLADSSLNRVAARLETLSHIVSLLAPRLPENTRLTLDLTEARNFEYHTGISFSLFAPGLAQELGRGGSYRIDLGAMGREATGFTLYLERLRHLLPRPERGRRVFVASPASNSELSALHAEGYVTLSALPGFPEDENYARELGCTHVWRDGRITVL